MERAPGLDRRWIFGAVAVRAFAYGFASVVLGLYLEALGYGALKIGVLLSLALAGGAALTLGVSLLGDRIGRRRILILMAVIAAAGGLLFAAAPSYLALLAVAATGAVSPSGKDRGAFTAVEQAMLPETAPESQRNWVFARYNAVGTVASALGALAAGTAELLQHAGMSELASYRAMFVGYSGLGVLSIVMYANLSDRVEPVVRIAASPLRRASRSRGIILGLAGLFALDAFGGALVVQSFLSYWFHVKFGLSADLLGVLFFFSGLLASLSFLAAARLARRFGLLNTMVFTHLPSNILLALVPLAPVAWGAVALYLVRESLSQMDVPTRQSYTVAVVAPEERTAAAGITTLSRNVAQSVSPSLGGYLAQTVALSSPFFVGAAVKGVYDVALYVFFRRVRPPEERR